MAEKEDFKILTNSLIVEVLRILVCHNVYRIPNQAGIDPAFSFNGSYYRFFPLVSVDFAVLSFLRIAAWISLL